MRLDIDRTWLLTSNQRLHWAVKARRTGILRHYAEREASAHCNRNKWAPLYGSKVRCVVTVAWPDRRRRDVGNLAPTVKAAIDGITSAGSILPDDSDAYLVGPDLRVAETLCDKRYACTLEIRFEEAS